MNQHAVPQNVTQYQFRLVGDMTLKQFLELALGLLLAYLFFASNLLFIFKWPLVLLSVFFGVALAFFPIEDRPLDQWIINFVKAIYRPTRFIWKKSDKVPKIFSFVAHPFAPTNTITKTIKAPSPHQALPQNDPLSLDEESKVTSLNSLFSQLPATTLNNGKTEIRENDEIEKPSITVRKLNMPDKTTTPPIKPVVPANSPQLTPQTPIPENLVFARPVATPKPTSITTIPLKPINLPVAPKTPNLIVGVATTKDGKLLEGAIVQVLDATGTPARAMKTNVLGQFATSTPLSPGTYTIEVDSDGHSFSPQQLIVQNKLIPPFEIRASS